MATNYNKWDSYNTDLETSKLEQQWEIETVTESINTAQKRFQCQLDHIKKKSKQTIDSLRSKAAVEALKAKSRRRRNNQSVNENSDNQSEVKLPSVQLADAMDSLVATISTILEINTATAQTLHSGSYMLAYEKGLDLLWRLPSLEDSLNVVADISQSNENMTADDIINGALLFRQLHDIFLHKEIKEALPRVIASATAAVAISAVECREYAVAADLSRCYIKLFTASKDSAAPDWHKEKALAVAMWLSRGRAFVGLGLPYMAHMHFRQVKLLHPSFPGIDDILKHLEDDEVKYAMRVNTIPLQGMLHCEYRLLMSTVQPCEVDNNSTKKGLHMYSAEHLITNMSRCFGVFLDDTASDRSISHESDLHMEKSDVHTSSTVSDDRTCNSLCHQMRMLMSESGAESDHVLKYHTLIRRCFYAAQVLYLEGLSRAAEVKYWLTTCLLHSCLTASTAPSSIAAPLPSESDTGGKYYRTMLACCLLNIATCRVKQPTHQFRHTIDIATDSMSADSINIPYLMTLSPEELCDASIAIVNDPLAHVRKALILSELKRFDASRAALEVTGYLLEDTNITTSSYIVDHGEATIFSQRYIVGATQPLPFMEPRSQQFVSNRIYAFMTSFESKVKRYL